MQEYEAKKIRAFLEVLPGMLFIRQLAKERFWERESNQTNEIR